jgi:hypothetical protein
MSRNGRYSDEQFIAAWEGNGCSPAKVARALGITERSVYSRRLALEAVGIVLPSAPRNGAAVSVWTYPKALFREVTDGVVIVGSDAHIWPGADTTALKALIEVTADLAKHVKLLCANGDWLDGARTNRHDPFGWCERPSVKEELACVTDALHRWRMAAKPARSGVQSVYTVGNHELNFERRLAVQAKDYQGLPGMRLADHFSEWDIAWSCWVNRKGAHPVMLKHRNAGGIHAGYNNTLKAGTTIVTGHTHILEVKPWGDYRGRRWGVQTGCLAEPDGPQFEYAENGPSPACSGFAVLTFRNGELLPPEICEVINGRALFRGQVVVDDRRTYFEAEAA